MQDGDGWLRRAVNDGVEPATLLFSLCDNLLFNYVCYDVITYATMLYFLLRSLNVLFPHRVKKNKIFTLFLRFNYACMNVCLTATRLS